MPNVVMIPKTVRLPEYLVQQIEAMASVSRRSFTKQVEVMLEQSIDGTVEADLKLLKEMGAGGVKPSEMSESSPG